MLMLINSIYSQQWIMGIARHNNEFMIIFRRQPPNFRLNCLSYHKKW